MRRHHLRFLAFCLILLLATAVGSTWLRPEEAFATGFDLAALVFIGSAVPLWTRSQPRSRDTADESDDGGRVLLPLVALAAVLAVLVAVGRMIGARDALTGADAAAIAGTLVLAWIFANLVLAFHYARIGLMGRDEIQFPGDTPPVFADYVYFSFVIGMTCQTADVTIASTRVRRLATLHGIAVFFFNLGVLALSVNVLSGVL